MSTVPLVKVDKILKVYKRGRFIKRKAFQLAADFTIGKPAIVGIIGPNGAGKTTLFELISGKNRPTSGKVICLGKNIHRVKLDERKLISVHYTQKHQTRKSVNTFKKSNLSLIFKRFVESFINFQFEPAGRTSPGIRLFDEIDTKDEYLGMLINYILKLRKEGQLIFVCIHPTERSDLQLIRKICERYIFIHDGTLTQMPDYKTFLEDARVQEYLGDLAG